MSTCGNRAKVRAWRERQRAERVTSFDLRLRGPGGEPVDLVRTLNSHGFVDLPPMRPSADYRSVELTLEPVAGARGRVRIEAGRAGHARVSILGPPASGAGDGRLAATVRHVLRLDADLSAFYAAASGDPDLAWVTSGAGRMVQSPTVFEDVVKTICTTNCTWSATMRMVHAHRRASRGTGGRRRPHGPWGRAFPTPAAMAEAGESFYTDVARTGYRGAYLLQLARSVDEGELDLEAFATRDGGRAVGRGARAATARAARGRAVRGRAHHDDPRPVPPADPRLVDPAHVRGEGRTREGDRRRIERRFRRYGPYAGLAFWLYLTRDWVD